MARRSSVMSRGRRVWAFQLCKPFVCAQTKSKTLEEKRKTNITGLFLRGRWSRCNDMNCNKTIRVAQFIKIWLKSQYGECNIPITRNCHFLIMVKCVTKQQYNQDNGTFCEEKLHQKHMKYRVLYLSIHIYFF